MITPRPARRFGAPRLELGLDQHDQIAARSACPEEVRGHRPQRYERQVGHHHIHDSPD